jgi:hypothetical protein
MKATIEENKKVERFIKNWQLRNDIIDFNSLEEFNNKFKKDMNNFLSNGDFSDETIKLFMFV